MDMDEVWDELHDLVSNMPVRCYTCGKVLARSSIVIVYMFGVYTQQRDPKELFTELGLERLCCRNTVGTLPASAQLRQALGTLEPTQDVLKELMAPSRGAQAAPPAAATPQMPPSTSKRVSKLGVAKPASMSLRVGEPLTRAQTFPYAMYTEQYDPSKSAFKEFQVATPEQERAAQEEMRSFLTERDLRLGLGGTGRPKVLVSRTHAGAQSEAVEKATLKTARLRERAWELSTQEQSARRFGETARAQELAQERAYTEAELEQAMTAL